MSEIKDSEIKGAGVKDAEVEVKDVGVKDAGVKDAAVKDAETGNGAIANGAAEDDAVEDDAVEHNEIEDTEIAHNEIRQSDTKSSAVRESGAAAMPDIPAPAAATAAAPAFAARSQRDLPRATVRLQFNRDFTFDDARRQLPYLASLGISHIYASPILTARAGSAHGYDAVDLTSVNPELGGEAGLRGLVSALREHGMGLIVDIVPNHMAVGNHDNAWWLDVLEWGRDSVYAHFFDIDWDAGDPLLRGRLLAPFLGSAYGDVLQEGTLALHFDRDTGRFYAAYYEHHFPIAPQNYAGLLRFTGNAALTPLATEFRNAVSPRRVRSARRAAFADTRRTLAEACADAAVAADIEAMLAKFDPKHEESRERLHRLLERQHYRLAWWRTAADEINWRRFFDIIELAGLRMQDPPVFEAVHQKLFQLYSEGLVDGFRVDHVDGLADPRAYCRKLRARLDHLAAQRPAGVPAGPAYLVVEKILAPNERLARDWRVDGTSGYVFMNEVGALLHDGAGQSDLAQLWTEQTGVTLSFDEEQRRARRRIPQEMLGADFNACAHALHAVAREDLSTRDWTLEAIRRVLAEILVHFPVYRTYATVRGRSPSDAAIMQQVVAAAKRTCRPGEQALVDCVDRWLGGEAPARVPGAAARRARLRAIARFQQLTAPVAAKAVEDTAFYRHGTLISRNEVGADPREFSLSPRDFHRNCSDRQRRYPHAMLATATHDHKRGEDVRARLAVLSEMPKAWRAAVQAWRQYNSVYKSFATGGKAPDAVDEYLLYQTLVGTWPLELAADDSTGLEAYGQRLIQWQRKAVREAKRRSGWTEPNVAYEDGCENFLQQILNPRLSAAFLREVTGFVDRIAAAGAANGLAQTLLRLTTPGMPDLYQGCELWDFSLVDPDNRRPVDYAGRARLLETTDAPEQLLRQWRDGRIKQRLIQRALAARTRQPELFGDGRYVPLAARGPLANHVVAFLRENSGRFALAAAVRHPLQLLGDARLPRPDPTHWKSTALMLPPELRDLRWQDALCDAATDALPSPVPLSDLFAQWPTALWLSL